MAIDNGYSIKSFSHPTDLLFVYGTLVPGAESPLKEFMAKNCEIVAQGWIKGYLTDWHGYPGLTEATETNQKVDGYILRLRNPDKDLQVIDDYEGLGGHYPTPWEYKRVLRNIQTLTEVFTCWIYLPNTQR